MVINQWKKSEHEKNSQALFLWLKQVREKGSSVSSSMLQTKALELYAKQKEDEEKEFTTSLDGLEHWGKKIWCPLFEYITGDILSSNSGEIPDIIKGLSKIVKGGGVNFVANV